MNGTPPPNTLASVSNLARASWESTAGTRVRFFCFVSLYVVAYSLDLLVPWAIGWTLGVFVKNGLTQEAFNQSLNGIALYVGLKMAYAATHHFGRYFQGTTAYNSRFKKLEEVFTALITFPLSLLAPRTATNHLGSA